MSAPKRATPRVREHVDKLREAGFDTQKFFDALIGIRDDSALPKAQREALYKLIAMESFVWYLEALRNEPIDRIKLLEEAAKVRNEYEAAIAKRSPGDAATELASRDIGATAGAGAAPPARRSAPPNAVTVRDSPAAKAASPARPAPAAASAKPAPAAPSPSKAAAPKPAPRPAPKPAPKK